MDLDSSDYTHVYTTYRHSKIMKYVLFSIILLSLISIPFFKQSWQAIFSVNANTGVVEINTHKKQNSWYLSNINISIDAGEEQVKTGTLVIFENVDIKFTASNDGNIFVQISSSTLIDSKGVIATWEDSTGEKIDPINESFEFILTNEDNYIFPIQGQWKIGDVIHGQTSEDNPILRNGQIRVYGNTFFNEGKFQAIEELLEAGDQMELQNYNKNPAIGSGFVSMNNNYGIQIQYHAEADYADINRFGSKGYKISPTIWNRLSNDPLSVILFNVFITLAPFILIYMKIKGVAKSNVREEHVDLVQEQELKSKAKKKSKKNKKRE